MCSLAVASSVGMCSRLLSDLRWKSATQNGDRREKMVTGTFSEKVPVTIFSLLSPVQSRYAAWHSLQEAPSALNAAAIFAASGVGDASSFSINCACSWLDCIHF